MLMLTAAPQDAGVLCEEKVQYNQLMDVVNWFFFDLLILGYVEDPTSGESFRLPGGLAWAVFVEVRELIEKDTVYVNKHIHTHAYSAFDKRKKCFKVVFCCCF